MDFPLIHSNLDCPPARAAAVKFGAARPRSSASSSQYASPNLLSSSVLIRPRPNADGKGDHLASVFLLTNNIIPSLEYGSSGQVEGKRDGNENNNGVEV